MAYKREDINGTSPLDIKKINDNLRNLWGKVFGDINFSDADNELQTKILTQWIPVQGEGNFDKNYPLTIRFFVPNNTKKIVSTNFNIICERYRMDSGVANGGGAVVNAPITMSLADATTGVSSVSSKVVGVSSVGGGSTTSASNEENSAYVKYWGNWNPDSPDDNWYDKVSLPAPYRFYKEVASNDRDTPTIISDSSPYGSSAEFDSSLYKFAPVYFGLSGGIKTAWVDLATLQHKHIIPPHTHSIPVHTHSITLGSHTHEVTLQPHTHEATAKLDIPSHEHSLNEGIKISTQDAQGVDITINGEKFASMNSVSVPVINNLDITDKIKIGDWNIIKCTTINLARVTLFGTLEIIVKN